MSSGNLGFYITHGVNVQIYVQEQLDGCTAYELQAERERETERMPCVVTGKGKVVKHRHRFKVGRSTYKHMIVEAHDRRRTG